jgi:two-component system, NtrC family, sensor histidine kinase KinB
VNRGKPAGLSYLGALQLKSLRLKILLGYILLTGITVLVSGWAIFHFVKLGTTLDDILLENYRSVVAAEHMMDALERQDSAQLLMLTGREEEAGEIFLENERVFFGWLTRAEENITIETEGPLIEGLTQGYMQYVRTFYDMRDLHRSGDVAAVSEYYFSKSLPLFETIKGASRRLLEINQEAMIVGNKRAKAETRKAVVSTAGVSLVAVLLGLFLGVNLVRVILKPVNQLTKSVRLVRDGRLDEIEEIKAEDEIGELAREFGRMTKQLRDYEQSNISRLLAEQKKSEAIVRSISDAIIVTDADSRILLVNGQAEEMFGIREKETIGRHFLEVIKNETLFDTLRKTLDTGSPVRTQGPQGLIQVPVNGREHYFQVEVTPVINADGQVLGTVTLLPDITHLKAVDQMKSDFVSTVSHEFRSPLATIQMGTELLREQHSSSLNAEGQEMLEAIFEDALRLNRLVNDLLDLSKMEEGKISMDISAVSLPELVEAAVHTIKSQAEAKGLALVSEIADALPPVEGDFNKLTWVLTNLLGNALRYTESGGEIGISTRIRGNRAYISVRDNGSGIPQEYQNKIFDKFVQVKGKDGSAGGAGLGLTIAREIVQAHRGQIWVESEEGRGSVFTFTVPVANEWGGKGDEAEDSSGRG